MEVEQLEASFVQGASPQRPLRQRPAPGERLHHEVGSEWVLKPADGSANTVHPLSRYPFAVGRDEACDLVISSPEVSRLHALILPHRGNSLLVRDQRSTNGTFVNGRRVLRQCRLEEGDIVSFGPLGTQLRLSKSAHPGGLTLERTEFPDVSLRTPADGSWSTRNLGEAKPTLQMLPGSADCSATKLDELIQKQQFFALAQPIVSSRTHVVQAIELLSAATSPSLPANPQRLLDLADQHGMAEAVSRAMRSLQIEQATADQDSAWRFFLNVHPREWASYDALVDHLESLRQHFPKHAWVLEIHECTRIGIEDIRRAQRDLRHLRIDIAFDDFGVEQSRIIELLQAAPSYVKFDATLTRHLAHLNKKGRAAVERLIALTRSCGTLVVAEGVETSEDIRACESAGFDLLQGYGTGRPFSMCGR